MVVTVDEDGHQESTVSVWWIASLDSENGFDGAMLIEEIWDVEIMILPDDVCPCLANASKSVAFVFPTVAMILISLEAMHYDFLEPDFSEEKIFHPF